MKCIVCSSEMRCSFSKQFKAVSLDHADYWRCGNCGFVASKTHFEMSQRDWERINEDFHGSYHGTNACPEDQNWVQRLEVQAAVIADLAGLGILSAGARWIDFGCGDGKLSDELKSKYDLNLLKFDRYEADSSDLKDSEISKKSFDFVVTTSVLEHLRNRRGLDEIDALVSDDGVMGLHTLVAEAIPASADWFYLLPVHCAFFTNKSMQLLFEQWGYAASIYHVDSRLWFWFKSNAEKVKQIIAKANAGPGREKLYYHFKYGFMDYWKLEAHRIVSRK